MGYRDGAARPRRRCLSTSGVARASISEEFSPAVMSFTRPRIDDQDCPCIHLSCAPRWLRLRYLRQSTLSPMVALRSVRSRRAVQRLTLPRRACKRRESTARSRSTVSSTKLRGTVRYRPRSSSRWIPSRVSRLRSALRSGFCLTHGRYMSAPVCTIGAPFRRASGAAIRTYRMRIGSRSRSTDITTTLQRPSFR